MARARLAVLRRAFRVVELNWEAIGAAGRAHADGIEGCADEDQFRWQRDEAETVVARPRLVVVRQPDRAAEDESGEHARAGQRAEHPTRRTGASQEQAD